MHFDFHLNVYYTSRSYTAEGHASEPMCYTDKLWTMDTHNIIMVVSTAGESVIKQCLYNVDYTCTIRFLIFIRLHFIPTTEIGAGSSD